MEPTAPRADIEVTGIMEEAADYDAGSRQWVPAQPPLVIGEGAKLYYEFTNHGPADATVTYQIVRRGMDRGPGNGYNSMTVPVEVYQRAYPVRKMPCRDENTLHKTVMTCTFSIAAGFSTWFEWSGRVNAPGRVKAKAEAWSDAMDPDPANNSLTLVDARVRCSIEGTSGDDVLSGTSGADTICARGGNDKIVEIGPGDKAFGEGGDDLLVPGVDEQGWPTIAGGPGWDEITYRRWTQGVKIRWTGLGPAQGGTTLMAGAHDGTNSGISHLLSDIEVLVGTAFHDRLEGGPGREIIRGRAGPDDIKGERGRDVLVGGAGNDLFHSRDGFRDRILGGPGGDGAYVDRLDRLTSSGRLSENPFADNPI